MPTAPPTAPPTHRALARAASCLAAILALAPCLRSAEPCISAEVRAHLRERVAAGEFPGVIAGVATPAGVCFAAEGRTARNGEGRPVAAESMFEIGSISKTFTALLYQIALDGGMARPADKIAACLPPAATLSEPVAAITLQQLATHCSGLPRMPDNFRPRNALNPYSDYTVPQLYDWLSRVRLEAPGRFAYSNAGMGLLGHIIELKAQAGYERLLRSWIADPLALKDTCLTLDEEKKKRLAIPHRGATPLTVWDNPTLAGAGAIRSTAADLLRWTALQAGILDSPLAAAMKRTQQPQAKTERRGGQVCIGWMSAAAPRGPVIWHNGGTGGTRAWCGFSRERRVAAIVLANSAAVPDQIGFHLVCPEMPLSQAAEKAR